MAGRVRLDLVSSSYDLTNLPVLAGLLFSALLGWAVAPTAGVAMACTWAALKWLIGALRLLCGRAFAADADKEHHLARWASRYHVLMAFDALTWGLIGLLFVPSGDVYLDGVLLSGVAGIAAVGVFTLLGSLRWSFTFLSLVLLPSVIYHLTLDGRGALLAGGGLLIYWAILVFESWRGHRQFVELVQLRHHNERIAEQHRAALALAEQSNAAKGRFLATVSHEIRTPLNGILGMAQLLQADSPAPAGSRPADVIARSARHLRMVIDDILDMSRIESGRMHIESAPFDLLATTREVADTLAPLAQAKGFDLQLELQPDLAPVWLGDAARVRQVLHNLVGNAIKFTQAGAVRLQVSTQAAGLRFTVTDSGPGIAPASLERIFEPFEQAESGGGRAREGTGLGLSIARQLARAMGGDVRCTSSSGQGSVFVFEMATQPAAPGLPPQSALVPPALPAGERVLVVEDNPVNALVAGEMLRKSGLQVLVASSGEEALTALATESFALVLMDCQMPGMDGFETTRRWRAREAAGPLLQGPRLPIVAVTANAGAEDRERCLAAGMDDFLAKPFDLIMLQQMVARWLRRSASP